MKTRKSNSAIGVAEGLLPLLDVSVLLLGFFLILFASGSFSQTQAEQESQTPSQSTSSPQQQSQSREKSDSRSSSESKATTTKQASSSAVVLPGVGQIIVVRIKDQDSIFVIASEKPDPLPIKLNDLKTKLSSVRKVRPGESCLILTYYENPWKKYSADFDHKLNTAIQDAKCRVAWAHQ